MAADSTNPLLCRGFFPGELANHVIDKSSTASGWLAPVNSKDRSTVKCWRIRHVRRQEDFGFHTHLHVKLFSKWDLDIFVALGTAASYLRRLEREKGRLYR